MKWLPPAVLFMVLPAACMAADTGRWFQPFTPHESIAQAVFTGMAIVDWGQTRDIARGPARFTETNPILGRHPTLRQVDTLVPLGICIHALIAWALPQKYRRYWQYVWIGIETQAVHSNYRSEVRISF